MMKKFEIGDKVAVLDDDISGIVKSINNNQITIETEDNFMMTFFVNELIKENNSNELYNIKSSESLIKKQNDLKLTKKQIETKNKFEKQERGIPEFDLHIEKLVNNYKHLSNFDALNLQLETAKRHIDFAIRNRIPKIILIHGVGEGILKEELKYLFKQYDQINYQDANYQKYGLGATELYFKQKI